MKHLDKSVQLKVSCLVSNQERVSPEDCIQERVSPEDYIQERGGGRILADLGQLLADLRPSRPSRIA